MSNLKIKKMVLYKFNKNSLDFEQIKISNVIKIFFVLLCIGIVFGFSVSPRVNIKNLTQEEKIILIREYNTFSEPLLIEKIDNLNFRFPYIILAQSYLESEYYKSNIFKNSNNMFGMKEAKQRATLAKGTRFGHAYYDTWQDSVTDYALFYSTYLYDIKTEGEYFEYLKQNYAEDVNYVSKLKNIIKTRKLKDKFK